MNAFMEGVGIFLFAFGMDDGPLPGGVIGLAVMIISIIAYLIMARVMLVKVKN